MSGDTAQRIIEVAQELIQTGSYNALSFNDIALRVGIKKPSVIHHFPNKAALVIAVIDHYQAGWLAVLSHSKSVQSFTAVNELELLLEPFLDLGETGEKICLCGALAGEFKALPVSVQEHVRIFFNNMTALIKTILERGVKAGEFEFSQDPTSMAKFVLSSLQGGLITSRATNDKQPILNAVENVKLMIVA